MENHENVLSMNQLNQYSFLDETVDPTFVVNENKIIIYGNNTFYKKFDLNKIDVNGKASCEEICSTHLCGTKDCPSEKAIRINKNVISDIQIKNKNNKLEFFRSSATVIASNSGNKNEVMITLQDISDSKAIEAKLRQLEGNLNIIPTPIIEIDKMFAITYINPAGVSISGLTVEEVIGKKCYDIFKTPHCKTEKCACAQAMKTDSVVTEQTIARPRDGVLIPIKYTGAPIKDAKGNIKGALEYILDVTEETKQKQESDEKVDNLNTIPTPIMVIDTNHSITYMNPAGASISGMTPEEIIGKKCYDIFKTSHCKTEKCACTQAMKTDSIVSEKTIARPKNTEIPIQYTGAPIKDAKGNIKGALEYIMDLTSQVQVEKLVAKAGDDVSELINVSKNNMIEVASRILEMNKSINDSVTLLAESSLKVKEMLSNSKEMRDLSKETTEISKMVAEDADTGKQAGNNAGEKLKNINASMIKNNEMVGGLVEKLGKIGNFVDIIKEIASQTNLLAFNAAIEAARAGDAGRGFAVVADEVRKLAENSSKSAIDIAGIVKNIQGESQETIISMKDGVKMLDEGAGVINNALNSLDKISSGITTISSFVTILNNKSDELAKNGEKVVEQVTNVVSTSKENQERINSVNSSIQETTKTLDHLEQSSDGLKNAVQNLSM